MRKFQIELIEQAERILYGLHQPSSDQAQSRNISAPSARLCDRIGVRSGARVLPRSPYEAVNLDLYAVRKNLHDMEESKYEI